MVKKKRGAGPSNTLRKRGGKKGKEGDILLTSFQNPSIEGGGDLKFFRDRGRGEKREGEYDDSYNQPIMFPALPAWIGKKERKRRS